MLIVILPEHLPSGFIHLRLCNSLGVVVVEQEREDASSTLTLSTADISSGGYYLRLSNAAGEYHTSTVVVEH